MCVVALGWTARPPTQSAAASTVKPGAWTVPSAPPRTQVPPPAWATIRGQDSPGDPSSQILYPQTSKAGAQNPLSWPTDLQVPVYWTLTSRCLRPQHTTPEIPKAWLLKAPRPPILSPWELNPRPKTLVLGPQASRCPGSDPLQCILGPQAPSSSPWDSPALVPKILPSYFSRTLVQDPMGPPNSSTWTLIPSSST